jgi:hypothetical protein
MSPQEMSQEKVGRHYEFECGFGIPLLKKFRAQFAAQSPQTPETPKRHQHGIKCFKLCFDARNEFFEPRRIALIHRFFDHYYIRTNLDAPVATEV